MYNDPYAKTYADIAEVLMEYGGMVATFMLGGEMDALETLTNQIRREPPADAAARRDIERELSELVQHTAYHPNHRAHLVSRAITLPHLSRCSHHIELATTHYYKQDFLSCVLVLLPAVEGVLRSYVGWSVGMPDPKWPQVREVVRTRVAETYPERKSAYAEAICAFHERWFWQKTTQADFTLSHLNRHYAIHSLGTESYYRAIDCHRLFLYFDTFADMLMYEGHGPKHIFLPLENPALAQRARYYMHLIDALPASAAVPHLERAFLAEHANFKPEATPPQRDQILAQFAKVMGLDVPRQPLPRRSTKSVKPPPAKVPAAARHLLNIARRTIERINKRG